ncbi:RICIN domain-containing protein [Variovorax sp. W2I14]|uniref:RICIN domain-containing protein n=1 Tax=Variovorax sp. W2I14 TaxID=3042290 RepID=UPI003D1F5A71
MSTLQKDVSPATPTMGPLDLGPYVIRRLAGSHNVLDVFQNNAASGTQVIAYSRNSPNSNNQQWKFVAAGRDNPGWWYLQTQMSTNFVITLEPNMTIEPRPLVMMPKDPLQTDHQLWCLQSTEKLGYWYIQSKYRASNSQSPMVIGLTGGESGASAVAGAISFIEFEKQAWGFVPMLPLG